MFFCFFFFVALYPQTISCAEEYLKGGGQVSEAEHVRHQDQEPDLDDQEHLTTASGQQFAE
jgi:hypothetical protein